MSSDGVTFKCQIAPILSAIKVTGDGGGMRVQFDVPESEMAQALYLMTMRECVLEITVKPANDERKRSKTPQY